MLQNVRGDLSPQNAALLSMNKNMAMTDKISENFLPYDFQQQAQIREMDHHFKIKCKNLEEKLADRNALIDNLNQQILAKEGSYEAKIASQRDKMKVRDGKWHEKVTQFKQ